MREKSFNRILFGFLIINCLYLLANIFISSKAMADDFEHLHASWLVWLGQVPYTDFFEHHHPLMWYVFAPLLGAMSGNMLVFFVVRFIVYLVSLVTLYWVYRLIKDFLADKTAALLAVNIFCFSNTALNAMVQFKPDAFMQLFFIGGLYCFFAYLRDGKQKQLNAAAVLWTVSFLFLQTLVFLLFPVGLLGIGLVVRKRIALLSVLKALILPFALVLAAVGFLYYSGNLQRYYELNWLVNSAIWEEIRDYRITDYSPLYGVLLSGMAAAVYKLWRCRNIYLWLVFALYVWELFLRTCYISVGLYYFKMLLLYNAVWLALALQDIYERRKKSAYVVVAVSVIFCGKFWLFEGVGEINTLTMLGVATDITQNSSRSDIVLATNNMPLGVFNQNPHYYWFSWKYIGKIDARLFAYAEPFDINRIIVQKRPKFVYFEDDLKADYRAVSPYDIQPEVLRQFYQNAKYNTLYQRNAD